MTNAITTTDELNSIIQANRDKKHPATTDLESCVSRVMELNSVLSVQREELSGFEAEREAIEMRIQEQTSLINETAEVLEVVSNNGAALGRLIKSVPETKTIRQPVRKTRKAKS